ncbi:MAG: phasin family protein [Deltaproteobacteria bacterium]|nr:phasin family protein [Deltaproteobacteria bacterium]
MAQKKTKRQTKKKASSRYYVVRSIQDARKNMTERVEKYHQEFIKDPIQSGKEVVEDFKDDPRKAMDNLVDDSRRFMGELKKDSKKKVNGIVADSRKFYKKAKKNPRKTFNNMVDDGRDFAEDLLEDGKSFVNGIEKDARIVLEEITDSGKKALDSLPGKKKFQRKLENRIESLPKQFNLPTRKDINLLMGRLEDLSTKINALGKEIAA